MRAPVCRDPPAKEVAPGISGMFAADTHPTAVTTNRAVHAPPVPLRAVQRFAASS